MENVFSLWSDIRNISGNRFTFYPTARWENKTRCYTKINTRHGLIVVFPSPNTAAAASHSLY